MPPGNAHVPGGIDQGKSHLDKSSTSSATSPDHVEGLTFNKLPQQVADSQGCSLNYFDIFKGQLQYYRPTAKTDVGASGKRGIIEVEAGEFPSFKDLNSEMGRIIYSNEVRVGY